MSTLQWMEWTAEKSLEESTYGAAATAPRWDDKEKKANEEMTTMGVLREKGKKGNPSPVYNWVSYPQIHWQRKRKILETHPEMNELTGHDPVSLLHVIGCVLAQYGLAVLISNTFGYSLPLWMVMLMGYTVGACIDHALWVLIHDATHDVILSSGSGNLWVLAFANIPHVWPSGMAFRYYHILHHSYLNTAFDDPDLPLPWEDRVFGHSALGKFLWMATFPVWQGLRTLSNKRSRNPLDFWSIVNYVLCIGVNAAAYYFLGLNAFVYLCVSSFFAIGLHPLGARWIAEHYAVDPPQETYSYYGWTNKISYNIGFHNEHHDFPRVPWSRLPRVRAAAPEFYETLATHTSYFKVIYEWVVNPNFTLRSRVVRKPIGTDASEAEAELAKAKRAE